MFLPFVSKHSQGVICFFFHGLITIFYLPSVDNYADILVVSKTDSLEFMANDARLN